MGSEISIGVSDTGYESVKLWCEDEGEDKKMKIEIVTSDDFEGVIYTRGSYVEQTQPCFIDPTGGKTHTLHFPVSKCKTQNVSQFLFIIIFQ